MNIQFGLFCEKTENKGVRVLYPSSDELLRQTGVFEISELPFEFNEGL